VEVDDAGEVMEWGRARHGARDYPGSRLAGRGPRAFRRRPMAVIESPESVGVKPFHEFDEANATWPRGERLEAIRAAAEAFRGRFKGQGQVTAVRTVDLVSAGYPMRYAFGGAARGLNPYVNILNRLVVVQFHDFEGAPRTLVWEPTVPEGSSEAPFYAQLIEHYGEWLSQNVLSKEFHSV
jgi:hypothetical protein